MSYEDDIAAGGGNPPPAPDDLLKVNAPCPICWDPSHWANRAFNYIHPGCDPAIIPTTRTEHNS